MPELPPPPEPKRRPPEPRSPSDTPRGQELLQAVIIVCTVASLVLLFFVPGEAPAVVALSWVVFLVGVVAFALWKNDNKWWYLAVFVAVFVILSAVSYILEPLLGPFVPE